jgi:Cu-Zn family superoxide dismutase
MRLSIIAAAVVLLLFPLFAESGQTGERGKAGQKAVAVLHPTEGNKTRGTVTFTREKEGIRVVAEIEGLSPGDHGFHVHEYGDCSSPDAESAGGHFNPTGKPHGGPKDKDRHVGDMGNIAANAEGKGRLELVDRHISFTGAASIIGRAMVVHAKPDDLKSQPTGDAGSRLACGVIGIAGK